MPVVFAARVLGALLVATLCGCASLTVSSDYDPSFDFSDYRTWSWLPGPQGGSEDPRIANELVDDRVRAAVEKQLTARGYELRSTGTPDFRVRYHAAVEDAVDVRMLNRSYGYGPGWGGPRGGVVTETYARKYEQGTLILDIVDANSEKLVWRGFAQAEVDRSATPEQRRQRIGDAIRQILAGFPPQ